MSLRQSPVWRQFLPWHPFFAKTHKTVGGANDAIGLWEEKLGNDNERQDHPQANGDQNVKNPMHNKNPFEK